MHKELLARAMTGRRIYANPYNDELYRELGSRREFYLQSPPPEVVLWEDERFAVVELPIP